MPGSARRPGGAAWWLLVLALMAALTMDGVLLYAHVAPGSPSDAARADAARDPLVERFKAYYDRAMMAPCRREAELQLPPGPERRKHAEVICLCVLAGMRAAIKRGELSIDALQFRSLFAAAGRRSDQALNRIIRRCTARTLPA